MNYISVIPFDKMFVNMNWKKKKRKEKKNITRDVKLIKTKMGVRRDDRRKIDEIVSSEKNIRKEEEKIQSGSIIELPLLGPTIYSTRGGWWREGWRRAVAVTKPGHPPLPPPPLLANISDQSRISFEMIGSRCPKIHPVIDGQKVISYRERDKG